MFYGLILTRILFKYEICLEGSVYGLYANGKDSYKEWFGV